MKKMMRVCLILFLGLILAGCSASERTKTFVLQEDGILIITQYQYNGPRILSEISHIYTDYAVENEEEMEKLTEEYAQKYDGVEGIDYKIDFSDDQIIEKTKIDYRKADLEKVALLTGMDEKEAKRIRYISVKKSSDMLMDLGFKEKPIKEAKELIATGRKNNKKTDTALEDIENMQSRLFILESDGEAYIYEPNYTGDRIYLERTVNIATFESLGLADEDEAREYAASISEDYEGIVGLDQTTEIRNHCLIESINIDYTKVSIKEISWLLELTDLEAARGAFVSLKETLKGLEESDSEEITDRTLEEVVEEKVKELSTDDEPTL